MPSIYNKFFLLCIAIAAIIPLNSCEENSPETETNNDIIENFNDSIPVYNYTELAPLLETNSSKIKVVNFWAMWCVPCVKELPYFQELAKNNPQIEVILISLDFPESIETELKPFLKERNINLKVVVLDDPDSNNWINKIDPNWSGAIPFTIIFNNKKRAFFEQTFENSKDLENKINKTIN